MHPSENWLGLPIHVNEDGTRGDPYVDPDGSILAQARAAAYEAARPSRRDRIDIAYHLSFGGPMLRTYEYARLFGTPPSADRGRGTGSYR